MRLLRRATIVAACALTLAGVLPAAAEAHRPSRHSAGELQAPWLHWLAYTRQATNGELRSKCRARPARQYRPARTSPQYLRPYLVSVELDRWAAARTASSRCELARAWAWYWTSATQCVVNGEGAWSSNTGNGYYGRFQADTSFARTYNPAAAAAHGPYAYSPNWSQTEQVLMGYRGWQARGYQPWPTTGRRCGLI